METWVYCLYFDGRISLGFCRICNIEQEMYLYIKNFDIVLELVMFSESFLLKNYFPGVGIFLLTG